ILCSGGKDIAIPFHRTRKFYLAHCGLTSRLHKDTCPPELKFRLHDQHADGFGVPAPQHLSAGTTNTSAGTEVPAPRPACPTGLQSRHHHTGPPEPQIRPPELKFRLHKPG